MNTLDITVALLSNNRPIFLQEAIDSVLSQTKKPNEFIVFDSSGCPNIEELVNQYVKDGVFFKGTTVPKSGTWNFKRAVENAKGKYLLMMHDDDRLCSEFIERQVQILENNPHAIASLCNIYSINASGKRIAFPFSPPKFDENITWLKNSAEVALIYAKGSYLPFPTAVYRTADMRLILLREEFGKVGDVVFLCDLAEYGFIAYQSTPMYEYRRHNEQDSANIAFYLLDKLNEFLFTRSSSNPSLNSCLRKNIRIRSTWQSLDHIKIDIKINKNFKNTLKNISNLNFRRISFIEILKYLYAQIKQKLDLI